MAFLNNQNMTETEMNTEIKVAQGKINQILLIEISDEFDGLTIL